MYPFFTLSLGFAFSFTAKALPTLSTETTTAITWMDSTTTTIPIKASPMGQNSCPYLPCPFIPPQLCSRTEPTTYWHEAASGTMVLCQGCMQCVQRLEGRQLTSVQNCETILCAPLAPTCKVSATREPLQLVDHNGQPCPVCPICLDYIHYGVTP